MGRLVMINFNNKILLAILMTFFLSAKCYGESLLDLEKDLLQNFVIETRKIQIPGYPQAFNPSIIRWNTGFLLSFRIIPDRRHSFNSYLGLVLLDENFFPISRPQILNLHCGLVSTPSRAEDGRLLTVGNKLYMVYSDNIDKTISKGGFRVYLTELEWNGSRFVAKNVEGLMRFPNATSQKREKNWVPFDYKGNLFLSYSIDPHLVLRPLIGSNTCEPFSLSKGVFDWDWGVLRGGTAATIENDEYLSFFHSSIDMASLQSQGKKMAHYFMGAYTFRAEPPFEITKISAAPIIGKKYYSGTTHKPYWKPVRVVFPCGFVSSDKYIWVSYGRQDHEIWITKLDKEALFNSLIPVSPLK